MIVLYNPWSTHSPRKPLPMSLLAVASGLDPGTGYAIVDGNTDPDPVGRIIEMGRQQTLTAIGVTVMPGPQLNQAVPDTRRLKAAMPGVPIVWGGYFPSQHASTILKDDAIDMCVVGQGERTFPELLRVVREGGSLASIKGLAYKEQGRIRENPPGPLVPLEDLPDWPYDRIPMERYIQRHYLGSRVTAHQSSYGCAFRCNFCGIVPIANGRWVAQSARKVDEIVRLHHARYGADAVQFHDMDFFIAEKRTAEFAERIMPLGLTWWGQGRVDELMRYSDATWQKMASSGLRMVYSGAEAASEERLHHLNKGGKANPDLTLELARRMKTFGVVPEFSFMLGSPPDPMADVEGTIRFIRRLKTVNPEAEVIMYIYTPIPVDGTLWEEARALGFTYPETLDQWISGNWRHFSLRRDPDTPWMSAAIKRKVREFERVLNAYYPTVTDTSLTGIKRAVLRALGGWRYKTRIYRWPLELRVFHRLLRYQRPETAGF